MWLRDPIILVTVSSKLVAACHAGCRIEKHVVDHGDAPCGSLALSISPCEFCQILKGSRAECGSVAGRGGLRRRRGVRAAFDLPRSERSIVIQGFGTVGRGVARFLGERGYRIASSPMNWVSSAVHHITLTAAARALALR
jgi:hypothetical protein